MWGTNLSRLRRRAAQPLRRELASVATTLKDGVATIPQAPGLGVTLNMDVVNHYRTDK